MKLYYDPVLRISVMAIARLGITIGRPGPSRSPDRCPGRSEATLEGIGFSSLAWCPFGGKGRLV